MKLTRAERLLIGQIVNVKLQNATLREHVRLETIFRTSDPDSVILPTALDFADEKSKDLFKKYDSMKLDDIEDKNHVKILQDAMRASREAQNEIWRNDEKSDFEANLSEDDLVILRGFYDKDQRGFPANYHAAILSLHDKVNGIEPKKEKKPKK